MNTYITPASTLPTSTSRTPFLLVSSDLGSVLTLYVGVLLGGAAIAAACLFSLASTATTPETAPPKSIRVLQHNASEVPLLPARQSHAETLAQF